LGERLLPVVAGAATFLTAQLGPAVSALTSENGLLAQAFGAVSSFVTEQVVPAVTALWAQIGPVLIPALSAAGTVMAGTLVPAFTAVWTAVATAVENNRGKFQSLYENIRPLLNFLRDTVAPFLGGALSLAFRGLAVVIGPVISLIATLLQKASQLVGVMGKVGGWVGGLFGAPALPGGAAPLAGGARLMGAAGGGLFGAASSLGGGGSGPSTAAAGLTLPVGDTYNITVTGALDPQAVAKQLRTMLTNLDRSTGRMATVRL
jgi:hypothetical protein